MAFSNLVEIGIIRKPKGLKGTMFVEINFDIKRLDVVLIKNDFTLVPYHVKEFNMQQARFFLQLYGIDNMNEAYSLQGAPIFADKSLIKEDTKILDVIIGYELIDVQYGSLGLLIEIEQHPYQNLLVLNYQSKNLFVPYHSDLIISIDHEKKIINTQLPDGYIEAVL